MIAYLFVTNFNGGNIISTLKSYRLPIANYSP